MLNHSFINQIDSVLQGTLAAGFQRSWVIGVSGGADSIALVLVLKALAQKYSWELRLAHVNYQLRGQDAADDEQFVRDFARQQGLPLDVNLVDGPGLKKQKGVNLEAAMRDARYGFFKTLVRRNQAQLVAVGHHQQDQVETVVLRALRGAAFAGVRGMSLLRRLDNDCFLVRPFLSVCSEDVRNFLRDRQQVWREDQSNQELDFKRNRVRHVLLPFLHNQENICSDQILNLSHCADRFQQFAEGYLAGLKLRIEMDCDALTFRGDLLKAEHRAGRFIFWHDLLRQLDVEPSSFTIQRLDQGLFHERARIRLDVGRGWVLLKVRDVWRVCKQGFVRKQIGT